MNTSLIHAAIGILADLGSYRIVSEIIKTNVPKSMSVIKNASVAVAKFGIASYVASKAEAGIRKEYELIKDVLTSDKKKEEKEDVK